LVDVAQWALDLEGGTMTLTPDRIPRVLVPLR
jgi:hypothetical protein